MSAENVKKSLEAAIEYLGQNPDEARYTDNAATATVEDTLRCHTVDSDGRVVISDMPTSVGGGAAGPSPGWLMRAALASCTATLIAMRAAQVGLQLTELEVLVDSVSDDRGILGMDESVAAGPLSMRTHVRIAADGVSGEELREVVNWAEKHCPVTDAIRRPVPMTAEVEIA